MYTKINSLNVFKQVNKSYILKWNISFPQYLFKCDQWAWYHDSQEIQLIFNLIEPEILFCAKIKYGQSASY